MRTFNYTYTAIAILLLCMLAGMKVLSVETAVAETAQVVAPDATQSPHAEDGGDLLNLQD